MPAKCPSARLPFFQQTDRLFLLHDQVCLLEKALEAVRWLPPDSQDEITRVMFSLAGDRGESESSLQMGLVEDEQMVETLRPC